MRIVRNIFDILVSFNQIDFFKLQKPQPKFI